MDGRGEQPSLQAAASEDKVKVEPSRDHILLALAASTGASDAAGTLAWTEQDNFRVFSSPARRIKLALTPIP